MFNKKQLEEQHGTIVQLRFELSAAHEKREKLENENKRLQKRVEEQNATIIQLQKHLEEQNATVIQRQCELSVAHDKIDGLENNNKWLLNKVREVEALLNKERADKAAIQSVKAKASSERASQKQPAKPKQTVRKSSIGFELTEEQSKVVDLLENTSNNYFITGKAGSGKSTVLSYFRENTKKNNVAVVALTGAAAMNVDGQTIHSLFRMDFNPQDTWSKSKVECQPVKETLKAIEVLIIDEVSMVRADIMDMIDCRMQYAKGNCEPFGGCQVIVFGDLYQLPPIAANKEEQKFILDRYGTLFFFGAPGVKNFRHENLNDVLRQTDNQFISLLNEIRSGNNSNEILQKINSACYRPAPKEWLHLTLKRDVAQRININRLSEIPEKEYQFETELGGPEPPSKEDVPFDFLLRVKVGARVMVTKNDTAHKYFNGAIGVVKKVNDEYITVCIDGQNYDIAKIEWYKRKYSVRCGELHADVVGWARQYPLRLAYAITVHKSQGQTYDNIVIDYSDSTVFSPGQTYVALSRCRTLNGIRLTRPLTAEDVYVSNEVIAYLNGEKSSKSRPAEAYKPEPIIALSGFTPLPEDEMFFTMFPLE